MLSSVLRSDRAIQMSIAIIRTFVPVLTQCGPTPSDILS